jgi:hypothetical protein
MTISPTDLNTITLAKGGHDNPDDGMCVMEAVAYFAKLPFSDRPECVSTVLIDFGQRLNDVLPDDLRQRLVPMIPALIGTRGDGKDETRSYMALDWLIRTYTPAWLDLAGLAAEATTLRDLRRIVDLSVARAAGPIVKSAQTKAAAAGAAAWDAAWAAAWAAAGAAAWAAAARAAAAGAAAWAAAAGAAAAGAAAWAAAGAAAGDALKPTVITLQESAIGLFAAMIRAEV